MAAHGFAPLDPPDSEIRPTSNDQYDEGELAFIRRSNSIIHLTTYHCEAQDFKLSLLEKLVRTALQGEEAFTDGLLTSRMSCGLCHQRAYRLVRTLRDAGVEADVFGIGGHVVVRAQVGGKFYGVDPDYGVGPFRWSEDAEKLTASVAHAYRITTVPLTEADRSTFASWYVSASDNGIYTNLDALEAQQQIIFETADLLFYALAVLTLIGLVYLYRHLKSAGRAARPAGA